MRGSARTAYAPEVVTAMLCRGFSPNQTHCSVSRHGAAHSCTTNTSAENGIWSGPFIDS
ncbi:MAG: hypothetical protein JNL26_16800 [Gemmatimonadetes bacterium]|nr:hypothetical protein [Gemmatimonadota bacterium]